MPVVYTASSDKTIARWSYNITGHLTLDFLQFMNDEILAFDVHPSGFYLMICFNSYIRYGNILSGNVKKSGKIDFPTPKGEITKGYLDIKGCKEIRFSNGGHLFACNDNTHILVYKFWTLELLNKFSFHKSTVKILSWLDDDTGLASAANDYQILFWKISKFP